MKKIDALLVDTSRGRIYLDGKELATHGKRRLVAFKENGKQTNVYRYHIVWYKKTGRWPRFELHHKDECPWNDEFRNLAEVTHAKNCLLSKRSGFPVGIDKQGGRFRARYVLRGRLVNIGRFSSVNAAVTARKRVLG
jgi:hypothetical protein